MAIRKTQDIPDLQKKLEEKYRKVCIDKLKYIGESAIRHARNLPGPSSSAIAEKGSSQYDNFSEPYYYHQQGKRIFKVQKGHGPGYFDWTSNLRSSIGYVIVDRGNVVFTSAFEPIKGGKEGADEGKKYAQSLASEFSTGLTLIVVAGMNYAFYVQRSGSDVLASAELIAEQLIQKMQLNAKIEHPQ